MLLLSSCAIGPNYSKPAVRTPDQWKEAGDWVVAQPKDTVPKGKWWEAFQDPVLNQLEEQVEVSNQTLAAAEARYRQAHAAVQSARSQLFPTLGVGADAQRARGTGNRYTVSLDARWEIDLWGRIRRLVEAARAGEEASAADVAAAKLSLQAELATDYFNLRATRAQLEHAIAILIGKAPADYTLERVKFDPHIPDIPPAIPSTLLERRPDIAAAERRMAAANAQIGVAEAAYFPALSLTGSIGFASSSLGSLFSAPSRFWSVGADLAGTLLDFGGRSAAVASARAAYDETEANYRQTVLTAFADVENNLAAVHWIAEETTVELEAVRAARESTALTLNQYKAGTVSFLNVALVQATQLNEERTMVQLLGRRLAASVALIRALGGGWQ